MLTRLSTPALRHWPTLRSSVSSACLPHQHARPPVHCSLTSAHRSFAGRRKGGDHKRWHRHAEHAAEEGEAADGSAAGGAGAAEAASGESARAEGEGSADSGGASHVPSVIRGVPHFPQLFAVPLFRKPAFPGFYQILQVQDKEVVDFLLDLRKKGQEFVGAFLTKEEPKSDDEETYVATLRVDAGKVAKIEDMYDTGSIIHVLNFVPHQNSQGGQLIVMPHKRIRMLGPTDMDQKSNVLWNVKVEYLQDEMIKFEKNTTLKALHHEIVATLKELLRTSYFYKEHFESVIRFYNLDYPAKLADLVAGISMAKREELQNVLAEENIEQRLSLVLEIAKKDLEFAKLQSQVRAQVEEKISKEQRKYLLMEQLKSIKRELGLEKDDKETIIQGFHDAIKDKTVPEEAKKVIDHELSRLSSLEMSSSEFNVCRTYLEWLTSLPWGHHTDDNQDIKKAEQILNEDHYGLQDVKDRILEFMAVNVLKGDVQGKIMCLVGPPGVGKTSIGRSVARALDRKFYRFSLGGLFDVAELRGHRRTYVGAMPGKLIQALKASGSCNPVILLDEVDKLGRDFRGDPASALLEILDPSQNNTFRDHYMDVPVDLSKVLFLCTANTSDTIPAPLLDRLEIIRIAGYVFQEKMAIANEYLIPQTATATGLKDDQIEVPQNVISRLVRDYAREAGVRNLLKLIEKVYRKAALKIVKDGEEMVKVALDNLVKFVGQPTFFSDRLYEETPPGVVMGLAWTQLGGATLYVEATGRLKKDIRGGEVPVNTQPDEAIEASDEKESDEGEERETDKPKKRPPSDDETPDSSMGGPFKVTGQLGSVMSESSQIALTFTRNFVKTIDPKNSFLDQATIHLHVPEGATPKDGPSAGITMATALVSLAVNKPVVRDLAMTGELTLTGRVLRIGGVKEKVIAARRENARILLFPLDNKKDYDELADYIKEGLHVFFVSHYRDVYNYAFGLADEVRNLPAREAPLPEAHSANELPIPAAAANAA